MLALQTSRNRHHSTDVVSFGVSARLARGECAVCAVRHRPLCSDFTESGRSVYQSGIPDEPPHRGNKPGVLFGPSVRCMATLLPAEVVEFHRQGEKTDIQDFFTWFQGKKLWRILDLYFIW